MYDYDVEPFLLLAAVPESSSSVQGAIRGWTLSPSWCGDSPSRADYTSTYFGTKRNCNVETFLLRPAEPVVEELSLAGPRRLFWVIPDFQHRWVLGNQKQV